jgi:ubiquinone biosynthesis protein COQ9
MKRPNLYSALTAPSLVYARSGPENAINTFKLVQQQMTAHSLARAGNSP